MDVELLLAPRCPNAAAARMTLTECLRRLNLDVPVRERVGDHPSPTILVDGVDVMTAQPGVPSGQACRLDVPTPERILAALRLRTSDTGDPARDPAPGDGRPAAATRDAQERTETGGAGTAPVTVRREPGEPRIVVVVSGALDTAALPSLRRALVTALRTRVPILIDLSEATSLHSDALTTLVATHRQAERNGTQLLLRTGPPPQMRAVLGAFGILA